MKYNKIVDFNSKKRLKSKQKYKIKTKKIKDVHDGGAAFAKGGFGCIFKPELSCKGSVVAPRPNYVSKLIEKNKGEREYMYVFNIKKKLENLPANIKRYFLLDNITMCEPKALSDNDKVKVEDVCQDILTDVSDSNTNMPITSDTINNNLNKFKIINMPELSMTLSDYIIKMVLSPANIVALNNIIIEYLTVVIPSMYKNNVVHGDVKPENMMFNLYNNTMTLIDWGLSYIVDSDRKNVPKALNELSVQYIHPFSGFLFKKNVIEKYEIFLKNMKREGFKITRDTLRVFAISEYINFMTMHDKQFSFLNNMFTSVYSEDFSKQLMKEINSYTETSIIYTMTIYYVVEYIIDIFMAYTIDYKFDLVKYFNEVYIMNIDSWGLMTIYFNLIEKNKKSFKMTSTEHKIFINKIMCILTENLFKNGNLPINIPKIVSDIKSLNQYLTSISVTGGKKVSVAVANKQDGVKTMSVRGSKRVSSSRRSRMRHLIAVANGGNKTRKYYRKV